MFENTDMFEENINVITLIKESCKALKIKINSLEQPNPDQNIKSIECLECLISELDSYNKLLIESENYNLGEVNLWNSIKSCVKSSNINHNKANRPNVIVEVYDKTKDDKDNATTKMLFDVEKNRNDEYGINHFRINHCLPIMKLIPTLLIDNAFKYCNPGGEIKITIEKEDTMTTFNFENLGPKLSEEERDLIWEPNYRGRNVEKTNIEGQGLGLFLFDIIINLHSHLAANRGITIGEKAHTINGIEYSPFIVSFSISNEPCDTIESKNTETLKSRLQEFTTHQYIRIMPRICKLSKTLFNHLYKNILFYGSEICSDAYDIKDIITTHFIYLQGYNDEFCKFSEDAQTSQTRLDKNLLQELEYAIASFNSNFRYKVNNCGIFRGKPTTSPYIDIFIHDFVSWLVTESNVDDIDFYIRNKEIEIASEEPFYFDEKYIENWNQILGKDELQIQILRNKKIISIA